jgi:hypothetical protein
LYEAPNIVRVIKSRTIRLAGHVTHMGKMKNVYKIVIGKPLRRDHSEALGTDL